ncbi:MAG: hypothetical protein QM715_18985 [Nibricoccus sp.]
MNYIVEGWVDAERHSSDISQERYAEVKEARDRCLVAVEIEEKFQLLLENYNEFEVDLLRIAERVVISSHEGHDVSMTQRLLLDRRIANLLTACRLFLDQTAHSVSSQFGAKSPEFLRLKRFKNDCYDKTSGYRIMEELRNHVQHAGLLVHIITYSHFTVECDGNRYPVTAIIPHSRTSDLCAKGKIKASVLKDLNAEGNDVDLRQPIREYLSCMVQLHGELRAMFAERIKIAHETFRTATNEFTKIDGVEVKYPSLATVDSGGRLSESVYLGKEMLVYYDELVRRNKVADQLERRSAANLYVRKTLRVE